VGDALHDARAHLKKAKEFLDAAEASAESALHNAAASNAVTSGINSKDAVCLKLTGHTSKHDSHDAAVPELTRSGPAGAALAPALTRLLKVKTKAQYGAVGVTPNEARDALRQAQKLYDGAVRAVG